MLVTVGCGKIPFKKTAKIPLGQEDATIFAKRFENKIPRRFQVMNSVVFNWKKSMAGIGYTEINYGDETFKTVCLNPVGIKLFEVSGNQERINSDFMLEEFTKYGGDFAKVVGNDIKNIYLDLVPSRQAIINREEYKIIFSQDNLEYVFAGIGGYLAEKNFYENNKLICRVSYYEYQEKNGKVFPQGIILNNYKYGYELIIKLKEIYENESN